MPLPMLQLRGLCRVVLLATGGMWALTEPVLALVNPRWQPRDLYAQSEVVLAAKVVKVDRSAGVATVRITQVSKGSFAPREVTLVAATEQTRGLLPHLDEGETLVAFVGNPGPKHKKVLVFYLGARADWQSGELDGNDPSRWRWDKVLDRATDKSLWGTFNGASEQLARMMADEKEGRAFFPAVPFDQFQDDRTVADFGKCVRGVALYDLDGDGRLDIYACSESGNRAFLQGEALKFTEVTGKLKLQGIRSGSCSFASVRGDGRPDLLVDGVLYLAGARVLEDGYSASTLLPPEANEGVLSSALVEVNGDGYPDVVVSRRRGGLHVYLNPGPKGGAFTDATRAVGLDAPACGAGGNGFFAPGDWNGDGRADLFYAVRSGLLLLQDDQGRFAPIAHRVAMRFSTDGERDTGRTGAACFAPLWRGDAFDLMVPQESVCALLTNHRGHVADVTHAGNELADASFRMLAALAEDLNADGHVDLYVLSSSDSQPNCLYVNRGYGSFMQVEKYKRDIFPGEAARIGAWGAAAGDVNGDGANDLLLGGVNGKLTLLVNDTLSLRKGVENPTRQDRKLLATCIVSARVSGRIGVLGARVSLADAAGRVVGLRQIGSSVLTGCRGPDTVNLAVREPGRHVLTVRFSHGLLRKWELEVGEEARIVLNADRGDGR